MVLKENFTNCHAIQKLQIQIKCLETIGEGKVNLNSTQSFQNTPKLYYIPCLLIHFSSTSPLRYLMSLLDSWSSVRHLQSTSAFILYTSLLLLCWFFWYVFSRFDFLWFVSLNKQSTSPMYAISFKKNILRKNLSYSIRYYIWILDFCQSTCF